MLNKYMKTVAVAVLTVSAGAVAHAQSVIGTITLPNLPEELAVDPYHNHIFVAVPNFGAEPFDYLTVINDTKGTVVDNIKIPPFAYAVAVDPITQEVYVGGTTQDKNGVYKSKVLIVHGLTNHYDREIDVSNTTGDGIQSLAVNLLTGNLYVANASDNEIDVIQGHTVTTRIPLGAGAEPLGVAVNPFTNTVYAAIENGNVVVINGATNTITTTTTVSAVSQQGITVDFLNGNVYTTNGGFEAQGAVGVLTGAGTVVTSVGVGSVPIGIDVDPLTGLVWVTDTQDGTVDAISTATNTVTATLPVQGLFMTIDLATQHVYVGSDNSSPTVTVISE